MTAGSWYERLARLGFAAKGVVYVLVGILAAAAAAGSGRAGGSEEALQAVDGGPAGAVLLGLVALGLLGYVVWRLVSAIANPEEQGLGKRALHLISGLIHAGLALEAARLALSEGTGGGARDDAVHWTAQVMARPYGVWAVGIAGGGLVAYALFQFYRGVTARFSKQLELRLADSRTVAWMERAGRAGFAARGVVFAISGLFLILAALRTDPSEARGLGGALRTLQQQPYGPWLLGAVAVGLVAYGLFQFVHARYRRLASP